MVLHKLDFENLEKDAEVIEGYRMKIPEES